MNPTQNTAHHMVTETPAELLRAAASYIDRYGWWQGTEFGPADPGTAPPVCAANAITFNGHRLAERHRRVQLIDGAIGALSLYLCDGQRHDIEPGALTAWEIVRDWNDEPERTITDVLGALRDAADLADRTSTPAAGGAR